VQLRFHDCVLGGRKGRGRKGGGEARWLVAEGGSGAEWACTVLATHVFPSKSTWVGLAGVGNLGRRRSGEGGKSLSRIPMPAVGSRQLVSPALVHYPDEGSDAPVLSR